MVFSSTPETPFDFIASGEANTEGYNTTNNGTRGGKIVAASGYNLVDMTVEEVMNLQKGTIASGREIFAAGRYQIIPSTMKWVVNKMGIDPAKTKFDEKTQDQMAFVLMTEKRPAVGRYIRGESDDIESAMLGLAKEWASFPDPRTGKSYYGSGNKAKHSVESVRAMLEGLRGNSGGEIPKIGEATVASSERSPDAEAALRDLRDAPLAFAGFPDPAIGKVGEGVADVVKWLREPSNTILPSSATIPLWHTAAGLLAAGAKTIGVDPAKANEFFTPSFTNDSFSDSDIMELRDQARKVGVGGVMDYGTLGIPGGGGSILSILADDLGKQFTDPKYRLAAAIGTAKFYEEDGHIWLKDTFNFDKDKPWVKEAKQLADAGEDMEAAKLVLEKSTNIIQIWHTWNHIWGLQVPEDKLNLRIDLGPKASVFGGAPSESPEPRKARRS